jgi:hypothetical protein
MFKSSTDLDRPGATYLEALIKLLAADVKPNIILSIGTAGTPRRRTISVRCGR